MSSSPRYDFVGISSKQLPYVHDSFPAGQKIGTVRYYTMRSVYKKGNDTKNSFLVRNNNLLESDDKVIANLKFPKVAFETKEPTHRKIFEQSNNNSGNIYRQKAYFRLKGIPINQVYSLHRTKTNRFEFRSQKKTVHNSDNRTGASISSLELTFPNIKSSDKAFSEGNIETDSYKTDESEGQFKKSRLQEMDRHSPVPGIITHKKPRHGRKLGNIVSSKRLQQLLDNDEPLDAGAFYYY